MVDAALLPVSNPATHPVARDKTRPLIIHVPRPPLQIENMNTGDLPGDIYFDLRAYDLPLRCADPLQRKEPDCHNPEVRPWSRFGSQRCKPLAKAP